jgi:putative pyruvate formate lyase activating enzyme
MNMGGKFRRRHTDFILAEHTPAYLELHRDGRLAARIEEAWRELDSCRVCPRECKVDRWHDAVGICRTGRHAIVASAAPHTGEEACLVGRRGSGTIFFSCCNLKCVFCQNYDLSQRRDGVEKTPEQIAELMLQLQNWGCHNINFVTPEHVVPQVIAAIGAAAVRGLELPLVYNTSAYDSLTSLRMLDGLVDIYMPDFKFWTAASARLYSKAEDYPQRARAALREMQRQVGPLMLDSSGTAQRGLLVRHLVMPGLLEESAAIFRWLAQEISPDTFVNILGQYRPSFRVGERLRDGTRRYAEIDRRPSQAELEAAYAAARQAGLWRFDGPR